MPALPSNGPLVSGVGNHEALRRLVDVRVVAAYLDVVPDTIYTMVSQRKIPFIKVGRLLKFDLRAIDEWITKNSVLPMPTKRP